MFLMHLLGLSINRLQKKIAKINENTLNNISTKTGVFRTFIISQKKKKKKTHLHNLCCFSWEINMNIKNKPNEKIRAN